MPPNPITLYTFKRAAADIAALATILNAPQIILGGHDWGGMIAYRTAVYHPSLVSHVFSIVTPYAPPSSSFHSLEELVKSVTPQFGYQLHFAGPEVEARIQGRETVRQFLMGIYGGQTPDGFMFSPEKGVDFDVLPRVGMPGLLDEEVSVALHFLHMAGLLSELTEKVTGP